MAITDIADIAARRGAKIVNANGIDIAYAEVGEGPPLVLLHGGLASTGPAWAGSPVAHVDQFATLGKHFRVIAPDTRGSGATLHPGGPATFDVLAEDVASLIATLELDRPFLAGFSEGGATATMFALRRPDLVRGLVNHSGFDYFESPAEVQQGMRQFFGGGPDAVSADPEAAERAFQSMPPMAATFATMRSDYDEVQGEGHWRTYLELFFDRHVATLDATVDDLDTIEAPTLILTGDRDMFCSVEAAGVTYRAIRTGELAVIPNTGHEITDAVIDTLIDFLARHTTHR
jgi:pimeloyl-ACP methyl ester carboxylesterase